MGEKFLKVYSLNEATDKIVEAFDLPVKIETVPVSNSLGYYLADDLFSVIPLPPFRKSLVDGYAVRSLDVKGASFENPVFLRLIGEIKIGTFPDVKVLPNTCIYVPTGGIVPDGADAVVMLEDTELHGDTLFVFRSVGASANMFEKGDELKENTLVLEKGSRINERNIGLINSVGIREVKVFKPIKIGFFSTGDEITDDYPLPPGKIFDFNRITLRSLIEQDGFLPTDYGAIPDDSERIRNTLSKAIEENDIILTTGGTSKGAFDFTVGIINSLGEPGVLVHGLNVSPGKPTIFGVVSKKLIVGLSGNPLAVFMVYSVVVRDIIFRKIGLQVNRRRLFGKLLKAVNSRKGREEFVLGRAITTENAILIDPILADSSFVFALKESDGYFKIPKELEGLNQGDFVEFYYW